MIDIDWERCDAEYVDKPKLQVTPVATEPVVMAAAPVEASKKPSRLGLVVGVIVLMVALVGGGFVYRASLLGTAKKLVNEQVTLIDKVMDTNVRALNMYKNNGGLPSGVDSKQSSMVLGVSTTAELEEIKGEEPVEAGEVLGLEDVPAVSGNRQLIEIYRDGKTAASEVIENDKELMKLSKNPLLMGAIKDLPYSKTDDTMSKLKLIYEYFEKGADLEIRALTAGFDIGVSLQLALSSGSSEQVDELERKIMELDELAREEKDVDMTGLPEALSVLHDKAVANTDRILRTFSGLPDLIRDGDEAGLRDKLTLLVSDSSGTSETAVVGIVSFWQDDEAVRSVEELKEEWGDLKDSL